MQILIRPFDQGDSFEELTNLLHRAYKKLADQNMFALASHQDVATTEQRVKNAQCFVAIGEGKMIGTIAYHPPSQPNKHEYYNQPGVASIGQFGVIPEFQKSGVGSRLMETAEQCALRDGATEIALDTPETASELIAFYNRRGYNFHMHAKWEEVNYRSVILKKMLVTH